MSASNVRQNNLLQTDNSTLINLILQFRNGDESAFLKIKNQFEGMIDLYACRICG
jgi:hypothetical protein